MHTDDKLLTVEETADKLGLSRSSVYQMDAQGKLPRKIKLGRKSLYSRVELDCWIANGCPPRAEWERVKEKASHN